MTPKSPTPQGIRPSCSHCQAEIELRGFAWSDREATTGLWFPGCSLSPTGYHERVEPVPPHPEEETGR